MRFLKRAVACAAALVTLVAPFTEARAGGVESTKISLPKGPASIEGLGGAFAPSLASGTAAYGVDLLMPPAVRGFIPKLSLDYDGGSGASELGVGWRIGGIPSIRRRTNNGLPRFDESDALELKKCPEITWTGCSDWGLLT
jgi:hypothetical protein